MSLFNIDLSDDEIMTVEEVERGDKQEEEEEGKGCSLDTEEIF